MTAIAVPVNSIKAVILSTPKNLNFPKGDIRRSLYVMLALYESPDGLSLNQLAAMTGYFKANLLKILSGFERLGVVVEKEDFVYRVADWGPVIKKTGLRELIAPRRPGGGDGKE